MTEHGRLRFNELLNEAAVAAGVIGSAVLARTLESAARRTGIASHNVPPGGDSQPQFPHL